MDGYFLRPVGAAADVRELEYICALHQTDLPHLRRNATISASDVVLYLHSRYGLEVTHVEAKEIIRGLGGEALTHCGSEIDFESSQMQEEPSLTDPASVLGPSTTRVTFDVDTSLARRRSSRRSLSSPMLDGKRWVKTGRARDNDDIVQLHPALERHIMEQVHREERDARYGRRGKRQREEYLDLVQMTSALLIPTILRFSRERTDEDDDNFSAAISASRDTRAHGDSDDEEWNEYNDDCGENQEHPSVGTSTVMERMQWWSKRAAAERKEREKAEENELKARPKRLIRDVLQLISNSLEHCDENESFTRASDGCWILDEKLVRSMLLLCGEQERAQDEELISEMINCARTRTEKSPVKFDIDSFVKALTGDILLWSTACEERLTTHFFDVFGIEGNDEASFSQAKSDFLRTSCTAQFMDGSDSEHSSDCSTGRETRDRRQSEYSEHRDRRQSEYSEEYTLGFNSYVSEQFIYKVKTVPMVSFLDFTVDTQWSRLYFVLAWLFFIFTVAVFGSLAQSSDVRTVPCDPSFTCSLTYTLWTWFLAAVLLSYAGLLVLIPVSLGNDANRQSPRSSFFAATLVALYTIPAYVATKLYVGGIPHSESGLNPVEKMMTRFYFNPTLAMFFSVGVVLLCLMIARTLSAYVVREQGCFNKLLTWCRTPWYNRAHAEVKSAATRKLNAMVRNAHQLHYISIAQEKSQNDACNEAILNYEVFGDAAKEPCGGLKWTWQQIWTRSLFRGEGYHVHSRLVVSQVAQVILCFLTSTLMILGTNEIVQATQKARYDIENSEGKIPDWVFRFVPEPWMVRRSFYSGTIIGTLVMFWIVLLYVPSTISTVMKLRSGFIPTLHDRSFVKYRMTADTVAYNLANSMYALVGCGGLYFVIFAGLVFLSIWPYTRRYALIMWAWIVGLFITILAKVFLVRILRANFHKAFYRRRPAAANVSSVVLECWHIAVGGGVLLSRVTQFLLASAFWIGRIDVPFLAENVNLFGYRFDTTPTSYRKDLLAHEAHTHPYIERLGAMYMMRLKFGRRFSTRAGACWRNILVLMLMPWLRKYRLLRNERGRYFQRLRFIHDKTAEIGSEGDREAKSEDGARGGASNDSKSQKSLGNRMLEAFGEGIVHAATYVVDEWPQSHSRRSKR